jgi:curved DNA-binding protein
MPPPPPPPSSNPPPSDYYATLGLDRSATTEQIRKAYRALARKFHPDVNKSKEAEERFKQINEAHEVLEDPKKRKLYDRLGHNWKAGEGFSGAPGGFDPDAGFAQGGPRGAHGADGFGGFGGFGGFNAGPTPGRAPRGARPAAAHGSNVDPDDLADFFDSVFGSANARQHGGQGFGFDPFAQGTPNDGFPRGAHAPSRDTSAEIQLSLEEGAHGVTRGVRITDAQGTARSLDVKVPPGVADGTVMRLKGQGNSAGQTSGKTSGDLLLRVRLAPHERFAAARAGSPGSDGIGAAAGRDLVVTLRLSAWDGALGCKADVPTLDGNVSVTIPAGTSSGQRLRLKGKGYPSPKGSSDPAGDLFVEIQLVVPKTLTPEQRELFERLRTEANPAASET